MHRDLIRTFAVPNGNVEIKSLMYLPFFKKTVRLNLPHQNNMIKHIFMGKLNQTNLVECYPQE